MSKSEILYVKGMNLSESDGGAPNDEDIWDDTQLNNAYDKALRMANVEVAKRIAMSTNSKHEERVKATPSKPKSKNKNKANMKPRWGVGCPCRAVYEEDGVEYEAYIVHVINEKECVIRYLGYDNSEIVSLENIKPSHGKEAQQLQIEQAFFEMDHESVSSQPSDVDINNTATSPISLGSSRSFTKKNKQKKKTNEKKPEDEPMMPNGFSLPDMLPMPNLAKLKNLGSFEMPMPPPPLPFPSERVDCEDQAISSMLLSWYMSGYYTGLYQGLKRSKQGRRHRN